MRVVWVIPYLSHRVEDKTMPYEKVETYEDVELECDRVNCVNNKFGKCDCDENVEDLTPDDECCSFYSLAFYDGEEFKFPNEEKLLQFEAECENYKVIHLDEWSLRLVFKQTEGPNGNAEAFIRVKKEDENNYEYRPEKEGSILVVDKRQT